MSDKKLLEESTIRRFQELARIKPLNTLDSRVAGEVLEEGSKKKASKTPPAGGRFGASAMDASTAAEAKAGKKGKAVEEMKHPQEEEALEERHYEEGAMEEASYEEGNMHEEEEMGGDEGEMGGKPDIRQHVEAIANEFNEMLEKLGEDSYTMDVEKDEGEGDMEAPKGEEEEESLMEAIMTALNEKKSKGKHPKGKHAAGKHAQEPDELEESIELIDDDVLAEELTQRVAARLVAEMKKMKAVKEGSTASVKAASGTNKPTAKAKVPKGHGPGKGTPFTGGKKK